MDTDESKALEGLRQLFERVRVGDQSPDAAAVQILDWFETSARLMKEAKEPPLPSTEAAERAVDVDTGVQALFAIWRRAYESGGIPELLQRIPEALAPDSVVPLVEALGKCVAARSFELFLDKLEAH